MRRKLVYSFIYIFLSIAAFISIFPFYWMIVGGMNASVDVIKGKITFGSNFIKNFKNLVQNFGLGQVLLNSLEVSIFAVIGSLIVPSLAGYGFKIYKSKSRNRVYAIVLWVLMIPSAALMVPLFRLMKVFNLIDSLWGVILPMIPSVFLIFFFQQNFQQYPKEIIMTARVDGASELRIFFLLLCLL